MKKLSSWLWSNENVSSMKLYMKTQYHPPALCDNAVWVTDFNPKVMNVVCSILRENRQTLGK